MKFKIILPAFLVVALLASSFLLKENPPEILAIGAEAPMQDYEMKGVDGETYSIENAANENGLLVMFTCNTCPFVVGAPGRGDGWQGRYNEVYSNALQNNVGMLMVNSNEAYRDGVDSMDAMKKHAKENNYRAPYVVDKNHQLADALGARTTPHIYLFNSDMELVYKGAIDDSNESADKVKDHWLKQALKNLAAGKPIDPNSTRQLGCSIKRVDS
jgi:peroxiredoxin